MVSPAIISGAIVGRMKFKAYIIFIAAWSTFVVRVVRAWVQFAYFLITSTRPSYLLSRTIPVLVLRGGTLGVGAGGLAKKDGSR